MSKKNQTQHTDNDSSSLTNAVFLRKAILINIIILCSVLIGVAFLIRYFTPTQTISTLTHHVQEIDQNLKQTEEKINNLETQLNDMKKHLASLETVKEEGIQLRVNSSYETLVEEFKILMHQSKATPLTLPFSEKSCILNWLSQHIQVKQMPDHEIYQKTYELLKLGNIAQALELIKPLAKDPSSLLYRWIEKAEALNKSVSSKD